MHLLQWTLALVLLLLVLMRLAIVMEIQPLPPTGAAFADEIRVMPSWWGN
jgi:hypothetical protein